MKAVIPLSFVVFLRFLGLFMVLPVISLYVTEFGETSAILLGIAVGGAYLTQIMFQTPFGIWSDRIERKKVVMVGLVIFLIGSLICGFATNMYVFILGRFIQGAGAIGAVVSAQITDIVREEQRTGAMAIMGGGIFASFTVAMLVGPIIGGYFGADWLFFLTALLTIISLWLLAYKVPSTPIVAYSFTPASHASRSKNLIIMNLSSLLEKMFMTLIFVVIPLAFVNELGLDKKDLWEIYAPGAFCGILAIAPASILAEKYGKAKLVLSYGVLFFCCAYILLACGGENAHLWLFVAGIVLFFIGFATLEPIMQSLTSKYAKAHERGRALGVFTTYGYVGSFAGGVAGGVLYHHMGLMWIGVIVALLCILWLASLMLLENPTKQKNLYLSLEAYDSARIHEISERQGVIEAYVNVTEGVIVMKYNSDVLAQAEAEAIASAIKKP